MHNICMRFFLPYFGSDLNFILQPKLGWYTNCYKNWNESHTFLILCSILFLRAFFHTFMPKYWKIRASLNSLINVKARKLFKFKVHFSGQNRHRLKQTQCQCHYNDFGQSRRKVLNNFGCMTLLRATESLQLHPFDCDKTIFLKGPSWCQENGKLE